MNAERLCLMLASLVLVAAVQAGSDHGFAIIVNKANAMEALHTAELERIYRGSQERWEDGQKIVVINRPVQTNIRRDFYKFLFRGPPSLKFFKPSSPIPFKTMVIPSDMAVVRFVAHLPNAIGYVTPDQVDDSVKVVAIVE